MAPKYKYTSHEGLEHNSLEGLGYDWEKVGDPGIAARPPFKIYLPRTTQEVVNALREARALGEKVTIRGSGHSSNDLVVAEHGVLLCTAKLDQILSVDESEMTVTVQSGAITAALDEHLAGMGYGLPVLGDHNDITAGGFASAGGIGPASHRVGLFVDNVVRVEYVDFDGVLHRCGRQSDPGLMRRVLAGTGRHGVIATLTLAITRVDKRGTILSNERSRFRDLDAFLELSRRRMADSDSVFMQRGFWFDLPMGKMGGKGSRTLGFGRFYAYRETSQTAWKRLRDRMAYGYLHFVGLWAGRLPDGLDRFFKLLGFVGMTASPKYGSIKNVESFTDRITDVSVGDPTRWLIALAPLDSYASLARRLRGLAHEYRERHGCFTFVAIYVKGIHSQYLSQGNPERRFCELTLYLGISRAGLSRELLESMVSRMDDLCLEHGAFRYMHTLTVKDPDRRARIDPNTFHCGAQDQAAAAGQE